MIFVENEDVSQVIFNCVKTGCNTNADVRTSYFKVHRKKLLRLYDEPKLWKGINCLGIVAGSFSSWWTSSISQCSITWLNFYHLFKIVANNALCDFFKLLNYACIVRISQSHWLVFKLVTIKTCFIKIRNRHDSIILDPFKNPWWLAYQFSLVVYWNCVYFWPVVYHPTLTNFICHSTNSVIYSTEYVWKGSRKIYYSATSLLSCDILSKF